ncbi:DUF3883 domain-containing protein [Microbulbifer agarilyticus]|uniref:DUF3883 domain-containing protein n=1 Tax=Microbulbifer agarilyticus TaxID=260552 RepID=UPI001C98D5B0|nr:DUF3883 domain-containing protein [Microbulbifer agarilyticus]MBY6191087.1 DUF3883 domain-containing protein [Microbulbifer agarilyticus]
MSLLDYEKIFSSLKMNARGGGEKSPHKVAMLRAVLELIENGKITQNKILFDQELKDCFSKHFARMASEGDRDNPHLPFFHLRSSGFWHHVLLPGKQDAYSKLSTASSSKVITGNIQCVFLDDELFELIGNGFARALLSSALERNLSSQDHAEILHVGNGWDWLECEAVVQDYFVMLNKEIAGEKYNKAEHRRALMPKLNNRSEGSIEFKHQNISATLVEMGQPYVKGYKPAFNYQKQLKEVVLAYLAGHQGELDRIVSSADLVPTGNQQIIDWDSVLDRELPERVPTISEPERKYIAKKINFSEREKANRRLGEKGEAFVIEFERYRLTSAGRVDLANEIEWKSKVEGDGLGYDIRSFDPVRDEELLIEVKTTNSGKYQPFFLSHNELEFSKRNAARYCLYRVYDFRNLVRIYQLSGAVDQHVNLQPQSYKASF